MKIMYLPSELALPTPDDTKHTFVEFTAIFESHRKAVKEWLHSGGYTDERTGQILSLHHADSFAHYMYAKGVKCRLIPLAYGDGWESPRVDKLTQVEVEMVIDRRKSYPNFWG